MRSVDMRPRVKRAAIAVAVVLCVLAAALAIPVVKTVERSRLIDAPSTAVRAQLEDLHRWNEWLPRRSGREPRSSVFEDNGAVLRWKDAYGKAQGLRLVSKTDQRFVVAIVDGADATFTIDLSADGAATRVTWKHEVTLRGPAKLVPLIKPVDEVVGPAIEESLAALAKASTAN
jgi:hypothetical protein